MIGDLFDPGQKNLVIAGVDEAGRGPLAGDVVAAAVILGDDHDIVGLSDSKKLSEKRRLVLSEEIKRRAKSWCIARASVAEIDELNILHASLLAMKRAVDGLTITPEHVYVDGNKLPKWNYSAEAVVRGDSIIAEISAASILAKVARDLEMEQHHKDFPAYGFSRHKGYPTKAHVRALQQHGPCRIHRRSFAPVRQLLDPTENG